MLKRNNFILFAVYYFLPCIVGEWRERERRRKYNFYVYQAEDC